MVDLSFGNVVDVVNPVLPVTNVTSPLSTIVNVAAPDPTVNVVAPTIPEFVESRPPADPGVIILPVPGPPGPSGGSGELVTTTAHAPITLSGHRIVVVNDGDFEYADPTNLSHASMPMHLTTGAITGGMVGTVVTLGTVIEGTWTWTPATPIYVGLAGVLSLTPPVGAWVRIIAFTRDATSIYFDPQTPIYLN